MYVRWIELVDFRSYASLRFAPDPGLNTLLGPNGHGKTSLLEALHLLVAGRSFRTVRLAECIAWDAPLAAVAGELSHGDQRREVRVQLLPRPGGVEMRGALCPWGRAVTFTAADLGLVGGAPAWRRAYLDGVSAKLLPGHADTMRRYRLVLQQRTRLLAQLVGRGDADRLLGPWDEQVATLGARIVHRRLDTLAVLREEALEIGQQLFAGGEPIDLSYLASVAPAADEAGTRAALLSALGAGRARETQRGVTLVGAHRDDLVIHLGRGDARRAASRGTQRLVALTLRLAEAAAVRRRLGLVPVFLLDDLLSELDVGARSRVLGWLSGQGQVLFSTTDALPRSDLRGTVWDVREAMVSVREAVGSRGAA